MAILRSRASWVLLAVLLTLIVLTGLLSRPGSPVATAPSPAQTPAAHPPSLTPVRIASWNLRNFSDRPGHDLYKISRIILDNHFDVLAIQEVKGDGRSVDYLLNALGSPWRSTGIGPHSRDGERAAFVFRGDRVRQLTPLRPLPGATSETFERIPYLATFQSGNFTFTLISVHLTWGKVRQREAEVQALSRLTAQLAESSADKHLIILGDFNEQRKTPNLHYLAEIGWQTVITQPTNLSSREIYDHIVLCRKYTPQWLAAGVIPFDETLFANQDKQAMTAISDHRPIWADFATNQP